MEFGVNLFDNWQLHGGEKCKILCEIELQASAKKSINIRLEDGKVGKAQT